MSSRGFTLIEIALVLLVISIITTVVLMTQGALFGRAGTASILANTRDLITASRDFKARYAYFPGDLPNAGNYLTGGGGVSAGCHYPVAGNVGNGIVDTATESDCAFEHLVKAGLISKIEHDGTRYFVSENKVGAGVRMSLWHDSTSNTNAVRITSLPCDIALELNRKLDSGSAGNTPFADGTVRARDGTDTPIATCTPGGLNDPVAALLIRY